MPDSASMTCLPTGSIQTILAAAASPEMDLAQLSLYNLSVPDLIYLASKVILLQSLINHPSHSSYHTQTMDDTVIQNQD